MQRAEQRYALLYILGGQVIHEEKRPKPWAVENIVDIVDNLSTEKPEKKAAQLCIITRERQKRILQERRETVLRLPKKLAMQRNLYKPAKKRYNKNDTGP